jgi:Protein of unknown function (DUF1360)
MLPHSLWWLVCDAGATFRLTLLVTRDKITEPFREWLSRPWAGMTPKQDYAGFRWWLFTLVTCSWCMSVWWAAVVVAMTRLEPTVWQYPALGLAIAGAAGVVAER